jgi:hypothetical protein
MTYSSLYAQICEWNAWVIVQSDGATITTTWGPFATQDEADNAEGHLQESGLTDNGDTTKVMPLRAVITIPEPERQRPVAVSVARVEGPG